MFRSRFNEAFPKSLAHFGPQELERGVVDSMPGEYVEHFLCSLLGLLLNRKQDVKYALFPQHLQKTTKLQISVQLIWLTSISRPGHYNRALEEAVQTHKAQWAKDWESKNPLSGGATFATMTPAQRVRFITSLYYSSMAKAVLLLPYCSKPQFHAALVKA